VIFSKRAPIGHPRNNFSIPKEIRVDPTREYGRGAAKTFDNVPIKDLITNAYEKKLLLDKVQLKLIEEFRVKQDRIKKNEWKNKAFELRS